MAAAQPYTILWQQPGMGKTGLPPAVSPWGDIFLPGGSGLLRLDAHGRKIWEARLPAKAASPPVFFPDGSTFVATSKALFEVKPYGRTGWSFTIVAGEKGSRAAAPNLTPGPGDLFYLLLGSSLYAVAPRRNMVWYLGASDYPIAVDAGRSYVYLAHNKKDAGTSLQALDVDGDSAWRTGFAEQKQVYLALSVGGAYLYAACTPQKVDRSHKTALYAFDAATGAKVWSRRFIHKEISNITIGPDGLLYLVAGKRYLYALEPATGREVLANQLLDLSGAAPAVDSKGTIFVPAKDGLYAVSRSSGRLLWQADFPGGVPATPTVGLDGRTIYFVDGKGTLYALQNDYS